MLLCFSITFLVSAIQSFIFDRRREKREQEKEQRDLEYHEERMKNLKNDVYYYKTVKDENDEEKTVPTAEDINIVLLDFHNDKYAYSRWEGLCFVNYLIRTSLAAE